MRLPYNGNNLRHIQKRCGKIARLNCARGNSDARSFSRYRLPNRGSSCEDRQFRVGNEALDAPGTKRILEMATWLFRPTATSSTTQNNCRTTAPVGDRYTGKRSLTRDSNCLVFKLGKRWV